MARPLNKIDGDDPIRIRARLSTECVSKDLINRWLDELGYLFPHDEYSQKTLSHLKKRHLEIFAWIDFWHCLAQVDARKLEIFQEKLKLLWEYAWECFAGHSAWDELFLAAQAYGQWLVDKQEKEDGENENDLENLHRHIRSIRFLLPKKSDLKEKIILLRETQKRLLGYLDSLSPVNETDNIIESVLDELNDKTIEYEIYIQDLSLLVNLNYFPDHLDVAFEKLRELSDYIMFHKKFVEDEDEDVAASESVYCELMLSLVETVSGLDELAQDQLPHGTSLHVFLKKIYFKQFLNQHEKNADWETIVKEEFYVLKQYIKDQIAPTFSGVIKDDLDDADEMWCLVDTVLNISEHPELQDLVKEILLDEKGGLKADVRNKISGLAVTQRAFIWEIVLEIASNMGDVKLIDEVGEVAVADVKHKNDSLLQRKMVSHQFVAKGKCAGLAAIMPDLKKNHTSDPLFILGIWAEVLKERWQAGADLESWEQRWTELRDWEWATFSQEETAQKLLNALGTISLINQNLEVWQMLMEKPILPDFYKVSHLRALFDWLNGSDLPELDSSFI